MKKVKLTYDNFWWYIILIGLVGLWMWSIKMKTDNENSKRSEMKQELRKEILQEINETQTNK